MQVGVNYPWFDYGWDFGLGPPAWRGSRTTPRWCDRIDQHLRHFRELGITVVRWFILADGLTYGSGELAPSPDPAKPARWRFDPPELGPEFLQHFRELLERFAAAGADGRPIQLLPVLIDFHFCEPGFTPVEIEEAGDLREISIDRGWVKQGRADAIVDPSKRARFLDEVLDPLLRASGERPEVIYAWEIINEPDWVTQGWHPNPFRSLPVPEASMRELLQEAKERIRRSGFKPTVGFASPRTLRRSGIMADINQFHHYPGGAGTLEPHAFDLHFPGILGEFATAATDVWPDLIASGQSVLNRLKLASARGYPLAMLWSFLASDRHTSWSPAVEHDVKTFTRAQDQASDV